MSRAEFFRVYDFSKKVNVKKTFFIYISALLQTITCCEMSMLVIKLRTVNLFRSSTALYFE